MGTACRKQKESAAGRTVSEDPELRETRARTESRVGKIPLEGRWWYLPKRLEDDYVVEKTALGSGYNGTVFSATSKHTGQRAAVKSFNLKDIDPDKKSELTSEVEIFLALDHPHVARLMEVYESDTQVQLVMECMDGGELYDRVSKKKVFGEVDAAQATSQMLLAVGYIHNEGVVHRDLKLENFLYDSMGSDFLKLIDFGFSKWFEKGTEMKESLGTISYVAPEVVAKSYSSGSCDMWSLGVIVFILLAGYMPFSGATDQDILRAIKRGSYVMKEIRWGKISADGKDFVKKLLIVEPGRRMTAEQALAHPWIKTRINSVADPDESAHCMAKAFMNFAKASRFKQVCVQMMAWSLTLDERRRLRSTFLEMDKTQTGVIRLEDVRKVLFDRFATKAEFDQVYSAIASLDVDKDGDIHYSDFLAAMMASEMQDHDEAMRSAFRKFDVDCKGFVTADGLHQVLDGDLTEKEVDLIFEKVDANADGKITPDEFIGYLQRSGSMDEVETH